MLQETLFGVNELPSLNSKPQKKTPQTRRSKSDMAIVAKFQIPLDLVDQVIDQVLQNVEIDPYEDFQWKDEHVAFLQLLVLDESLKTFSLARSENLRNDVATWIASRDQDYQFSFHNCALTAGCNPEELRDQFFSEYY